MHAKLVSHHDLFFGVLPSSAVPPHRILFPFVGRTMHREFGDHKYRNGHSSPLKDAGVRRISGGTALADRRLPGVIGEKVVDRVSRFRVYELVGVHKEYLAPR